VQGNFIGTSLTGATAIPNSDGVFVINSSGNVIDGTAASAGNVNSGNTSDGVHLAYGTAVSQPNSEHLISTTYPLNRAADVLRWQPCPLPNARVHISRSYAGTRRREQTAP